MVSMISIRRIAALLILWEAFAFPIFGQTDELDAAALAGGDAFFRQALAAIDAGNVDRATEIFQNARKEAGKKRDVTAKSRAQEGLKRIRGLYGPFYEQMNRSQSLRQKGDLAGSQAATFAALEFMEKPRLGSPMEWKDLDQRLAQRARSEGDLVQRQRLQQYRERMGAAEQLLWERHYEQAIPELESAKSLLVPEKEESQIKIIDRMINDANYNLHFEIGRKLTEQEDFKGALTEYKAAAEHVNNNEVQEKIKEAESRVHYALLQEAQEAFNAKKYPLAADKMEEAGTYRQSSYLEQFRQNAYDDLVNQGKQSNAAQQYDKAMEQFRAAQLFKDDDSIRQNISAVKNSDYCKAELEKAKELMDRQLISAARKHLLRVARRQQDNQEANQYLAKIDAYYNKISEGRKLIKTDPVSANKLFIEAYQIFPTEEAKEWISKSQEQGGGVRFG